MIKKSIFVIVIIMFNYVFADKFIVIENNSDIFSLYNIDKTNGTLNKIGQGSSIGSGPSGGLISPDGSSLFILNNLSMDIAKFSLVDIKSNKLNNGSITGQIGVDNWGGSFTPNGNGLLVSSMAQNKIDYFSYEKSTGTLKKIKEINLKHCSGGYGMTFVPNTNVMYLNCYNSGSIEKLSFSSSSNTYVEEKVISLGNGFGLKPRGIMLDGTNKKAYISSEGSGAIYVHNYIPSTGEIGIAITQINTNFALLAGTSFDPYGNMIAIDRNTGTLNYYKKDTDSIYKNLIRSCHLGKTTLGSISFDNNGHMYAITRGDNSITLYNVSADKCPQMIQNVTTLGMPFGLIRIND